MVVQRPDVAQTHDARDVGDGILSEGASVGPKHGVIHGVVSLRIRFDSQL